MAKYVDYDMTVWHYLASGSNGFRAILDRATPGHLLRFARVGVPGEGTLLPGVPPTVRPGDFLDLRETAYRNKAVHATDTKGVFWSVELAEGAPRGGLPIVIDSGKSVVITRECLLVQALMAPPMITREVVIRLLHDGTYSRFSTRFDVPGPFKQYYADRLSEHRAFQRDRLTLYDYLIDYGSGPVVMGPVPGCPSPVIQELCYLVDGEHTGRLAFRYTGLADIRTIDVKAGPIGPNTWITGSQSGEEIVYDVRSGKHYLVFISGTCFDGPNVQIGSFPCEMRGIHSSRQYVLMDRVSILLECLRRMPGARSSVFAHFMWTKHRERVEAFLNDVHVPSSARAFFKRRLTEALSAKGEWEPMYGQQSLARFEIPANAPRIDPKFKETEVPENPGPVKLTRSDFSSLGRLLT